jgi:ubiquilin
MSPEMVSQMLSNPAVEQMLSNPEVMRSIMNSNPQLQAMMDANPHIRQVMNDPAVMRQTMEMMRNPNAMREAMRHQDIAMSQLENHPEGFNALRRLYEDVQEPMMSASQTPDPASRSPSISSSPSSSSTPNNAALPNPWGPQPQQPVGLGSTGLPGFGGFPGAGSGFGGFPGAGMGSLPGLPPGMDMASMSAMMSNPMIQAQMQEMFRNPQMMAQMAAMNPQLGQMMANPQVAAMLQNPAMIQQVLNPANLQAMMNMQASMQQLQSSGLIPGYLTPAQGGPGLDFSSILGPGPTPFPVAPVPSAVPIDPAVNYASQLQQLQDMGFSDAARNLQALVQTNGNVNAAVERLLGAM